MLVVTAADVELELLQPGELDVFDRLCLRVDLRIGVPPDVFSSVSLKKEVDQLGI